MILYENITIAVDKEGEVWMAYAYDAKTEQNISSCKCTREGGAIAGLFNDLRNEAIKKAEK